MAWARQNFQDWSWARIVCRHVRTWVAVLCVTVWGTAARAGDVVIVLSGDNAPYVQAETGLKKQFADKNRGTRTLALQDVSTKGLDATIGNKADLVVAVGTPAAVWLHGKLPAATPLVYCMVSDPASVGLGEGRPSYGVSTDVPLKAQLELIAEAFPNGHTVGLLYRANTPEGQRLVKNVQEALPERWKLKAVPIDNQASIAEAIDVLLKQRVDVVWTTADSAIYDTASVRALLLASLRTSTPVFGFSTAFVKAGALLGIGVDPQVEGMQAAALGLRVLNQGDETPPPRINPPERVQIAVNLIVASQINVELPQDLVQRAANVFKEGR